MEIKTTEDQKQNLEVLLQAAQYAVQILDQLAQRDKRHGAFSASRKLKEALANFNQE